MPRPVKLSVGGLKQSKHLVVDLVGRGGATGKGGYVAYAHQQMPFANASKHTGVSNPQKPAVPPVWNKAGVVSK